MEREVGSPFVPALGRRGFLKAGVALAGVAALPGPAWAMLAPAYKTRRVLLVLFAGGVRSRDTIGTPANVPNLMRMAKGGVVLPNCRSANLGHYGASLSILTGAPEYMGIRENSRGYNPTVFEYVRKSLALPASGVWLSANNGSQGVNFAYGLHRQWGAPFGANVIDGDGIFNQEFREVLAQFGTPRGDSPAEAAALARLRGAVRVDGDAKALNDEATAARVEKYIVDEITRSETVSMTGPGAGDAKALRIAGNILQIFKPTLACVSLTNADVAHSSYNAYVDVIKRNDQELGRILDAVEQDATLRDSTSIFVVPEFGRDKNLNQRNGLDHGDGSDDLNKVACVAWGPDFKPGKTITADCDTIDLCPTICRLLGVEAPLARGKPLPRLLG
ncbi:MAG: twin-arginine translocation signal domain-containing protein [Planctomycetes bacterium]|nr:twin-arginine translocation signal domain-containing protein [Planctomycetota bacterium]